MSNEVSIVIADDHPLLLKGLEDHLGRCGYSNISSASDGCKAKELILNHNPELAILDIDMPCMTGIEVARDCRSSDSNTKIILLSYLKDPEFILQAKDANISGYLIKEDALMDLERCIRSVMRGELFYSLQLREVDVSQMNMTMQSLNELTPSELKILRLISTGNSSREIKDLLGVSQRTVEKHRSNIIHKLNLSSQAFSLTQWAMENKSLI